MQATCSHQKTNDHRGILLMVKDKLQRSDSKLAWVLASEVDGLNNRVTISEKDSKALDDAVDVLYRLSLDHVAKLVKCA